MVCAIMRPRPAAQLERRRANVTTTGSTIITVGELMSSCRLRLVAFPLLSFVLGVTLSASSGLVLQR